MPAARSALPALTDSEVAALRDRLERGATARVRLRAGGTGTVVSVGNPDSDGPEYIKVKVTLNGTRDVLPFAPDDLASTSRNAPAKDNAVNGSDPSPTSAATAPPASPPPTAAPSSKSNARRRPRPAPVATTPNVVITLRTADPGWLADATREGETITEGVAASADLVKAVADQLADINLSRAVADVAAGHRSKAAKTVERLRAELAAAETLLASYTPGQTARPAGRSTD